MASLIRGTTITLYDRVRVGTDDFNAPIYEEMPIEVPNVLICPVNTADIVSDIQLNGKKAEYELCIPKKNANVWENRVVEFFGCKWRTIGFPQEWMEENVPLDWNRKVLAVRYG